MAKRDDKAQYIKISELKPYENNARTHSNEQIEAICNSIKEFGFINPVIIDENNMILVGHGRIEAAKVLGLDEAPYRRVTNLTEDQKRAYILADNKLSDLGGWDESLLAQELGEIELDMSLFGFDNVELEDLDFDTADIEEDDIPEIDEKVEPKSKLGDIYKLGNHFLMCGDSTSETDVNKLLSYNRGGSPVDLLLTDPPYNVAYEGKTDEALTIENDKMDSNNFIEFLTVALTNAARGLKEGCPFYVWYASSNYSEFKAAIVNAGLTEKQQLVWNKNTFTLGRQDHQWKHEPCFYGWKEGAPHKWYGGRNKTTVYDYDKPNASRLHPTMKPVGLIAEQISNSTQKGDVVLDIFGGSGTTLIACEQLKRKCLTMELDPRFVDVIVKRWEDLTEQKAVLVNG